MEFVYIYMFHYLRIHFSLLVLSNVDVYYMTFAITVTSSFRSGSLTSFDHQLHTAVQMVERTIWSKLDVIAFLSRFSCNSDSLRVVYLSACYHIHLHFMLL